MRDYSTLHFQTQIKVNEHEVLSNFTLKTQIKVKKQLVVRKDMDVNEHERLSNITHRLKLK